MQAPSVTALGRLKAQACVQMHHSGAHVSLQIVLCCNPASAGDSRVCDLLQLAPHALGQDAARALPAGAAWWRLNLLQSLLTEWGVQPLEAQLGKEPAPAWGMVHINMAETGQEDVSNNKKVRVCV